MNNRQFNIPKYDKKIVETQSEYKVKKLIINFNITDRRKIMRHICRYTRTFSGTNNFQKYRIITFIFNQIIIRYKVKIISQHRICKALLDREKIEI